MTIESLLRSCGVEQPAEVLADLQEEAAARRSRGHGAARVMLWRLAQIALVIVWAWRDGREHRRHEPLRPGLALRIAAINLRRQPGVPLAAALILATGFGAAATIFGVLAGFDRSLPVPDGDRIVRVRVYEAERGAVPVSGAEAESWEEIEGLDGFGLVSRDSFVVGVEGTAPRRVQGARLSPRVLPLLRVPPEQGAYPAASGQDVLLSQTLAERLYGPEGRPVGRAIRIDGRPHVVAGVMPAGFHFPLRDDLWLVQPAATLPDGGEFVGRLAAGADPDRIGAGLAARLAGARQLEADALRVSVVGFTAERGEGGEKVALMALLILVVALLLVACSNVSNLLLGRALHRARALAVHAAIGAGPRQVVLQSFAEALLISLAGAAFGLLAAAGAIHYIETTLADHWGYYWMRVALDLPVVLFALALALLGALTSGTLPALRAGRTDLAEPLKNAAASRGGVGGTRVAAVLLTVQVGFSCAALVVASLMASGLLSTASFVEGFPAEQIRVASVDLDLDGYVEPTARNGFFEALLADLDRSESITAAAITTGVPGLNGQVGRLRIEGAAEDPRARPARALSVAVSPSYLDLFDLQVLEGRPLQGGDGVGDELVAVVSAAFVREHLGGQDAIGTGLRLEGVTDPDRWVRVVGVVSDLRMYSGEDSRSLARVYLPLPRVSPRHAYVIYRPELDAAEATAALGGALAKLDPDLPLAGVFAEAALPTLADVADYVREFFRTTGLLSVLGSVAAAVVAMLGLFGAVAFEVERRTPEIGVRMALGADRGQVLRRVLARAMRQVLPGIVLGIGAAWLAGPLFGVFLSGAEARDPMRLAAVAAGYVTVALLASLVPARRAAGLDPVAVLRRE